MGYPNERLRNTHWVKPDDSDSPPAGSKEVQLEDLDVELTQRQATGKANHDYYPLGVTLVNKKTGSKFPFLGIFNPCVGGSRQSDLDKKHYMRLRCSVGSDAYNIIAAVYSKVYDRLAADAVMYMPGAVLGKLQSISKGNSSAKKVQEAASKALKSSNRDASLDTNQGKAAAMSSAIKTTLESLPEADRSKLEQELQQLLQAERPLTLVQGSDGMGYVLRGGEEGMDLACFLKLYENREDGSPDMKVQVHTGTETITLSDPDKEWDTISADRGFGKGYQTLRGIVIGVELNISLSAAKHPSLKFTLRFASLNEKSEEDSFFVPWDTPPLNEKRERSRSPTRERVPPNSPMHDSIFKEEEG